MRRFRPALRRALAPAIVAGLLAIEMLPAAAGPPGTGQTTLVSHVPSSTVRTSTAPANALAITPIPSADGAYVVFQSTATDLVPGQADANSGFDVFLYERATTKVRLVSHSIAGGATAGNALSTSPSISADGAYVTFVSTATDLVAGQTDNNFGADVFVYTRATGAIALVSHASAKSATASNGVSAAPAISADGAYVAFQSGSTNLVAGQVDTNTNDDVFLYARATGGVTLVSHAAGAPTTASNGTSSAPLIDGDGGVVAFESASTNLVAGQVDANNDNDAFTFDRATGAVSLASHAGATATTAGNGASVAESLSADGAWLAFQSAATNLVTGETDTNTVVDVFLSQRATGATTIVSHAAASATATANGVSTAPSIGANGDLVSFVSLASNLVTGQVDTNNDEDIFVFERASGATRLASHTPAGATVAGNASGAVPRMSADGSSVVFQSAASNLVAGQTESNTLDDVFRYVVATGAVSLVSHVPGSSGTTGNAISQAPRPTATGAFVAFQSRATTLVAGQLDTNHLDDILLFQVADTAPAADFDGNGTTDISVFRPSNATFYVNGGASVHWGATGDIPVPADYDGDNRTDQAVVRPSSALWAIHGSAGFDVTVTYGVGTDVPVPADYDGDGRADIAVFRPSTGTWYVHRSTDNVDVATTFGIGGDVPVLGDYDGDTRADLAVFRPSSGTWFGHPSGGGTDTAYAYGANGDVPVPGDYSGDGRTDIAIFRPSTGLWSIHPASGPDTALTYGVGTDVPVAGDYDADRRTDVAVFRPATGAWYVHRSGTGTDVITTFGISTDIPLPIPAAIRLSL